MINELHNDLKGFSRGLTSWPTLNLRYKETIMYEDEVVKKTENKLQQMYQFSDGTLEWRDIEIVKD